MEVKPVKRILTCLALVLALTIFWFAWMEFAAPHMPWWQEAEKEGTEWLRQNAFSNNDYVREGYPGWQETKLAGLDSFRIPPDWQLTAATKAADKSGRSLPQAVRIPVTVTDASGAHIARGLLYPTSGEAPEFRDVLSETAGFQVESFDRGEKLNAGFGGREVRYFPCTAIGNGKRTELLCLMLSDGDASVYLCFPDCQGEAYAALYYQVDAIAASFHGAGVAQE